METRDIPPWFAVLMRAMAECFCTGIHSSGNPTLLQTAPDYRVNSTKSQRKQHLITL